MINDRIYSRSISNAHMKMSYGLRPTQTRYVHLPTTDVRKKVTVRCHETPVYNTETMFAPSSSLPFTGYQSNVDTETILRNTVFPLQSGSQVCYIPDTTSDLYETSQLIGPGNAVIMTNKLLFSKQQFESFNPNTHNTGTHLFNNHTRTQLRDL